MTRRGAEAGGAIGRAERIAAEIAHGRLLRERDPSIWAWSTPAGERRGRRRAARIVEAGGFHAGQRLLEIGCATGTFTAWVGNASGARVLGVDISPDLIDEARRRLPGLDFEIADAHALPFAAGAFDGVFGSSTLHHLELDPALAEVLRVLKPGARMVFAEPNLLNPQVLAQKRVPAIRRRSLELAHETAFVRGPIARVLRRAGFDAVKVTPFDFLHPLTPPPMMGVVAGLGAWLERLPLIREFAGSLLIVGRKAE